MPDLEEDLRRYFDVLASRITEPEAESQSVARRGRSSRSLVLITLLVLVVLGGGLALERRGGGGTDQEVTTQPSELGTLPDERAPMAHQLAIGTDGYVRATATTGEGIELKVSRDVVDAWALQWVDLGVATSDYLTRNSPGKAAANACPSECTPYPIREEATPSGGVIEEWAIRTVKGDVDPLGVATLREGDWTLVAKGPGAPDAFTVLQSVSMRVAPDGFVLVDGAAAFDPGGDGTQLTFVFRLADGTQGDARVARGCPVDPEIAMNSTGWECVGADDLRITSQMETYSEPDRSLPAGTILDARNG